MGTTIKCGMTYSDLTTLEIIEFNALIDADRLARPLYPTPTDLCDSCSGTGWTTVIEECDIPGGRGELVEIRCACAGPSDNLDDDIPF